MIHILVIIRGREVITREGEDEVTKVIDELDHLLSYVFGIRDKLI